jgi:hypothetical protein
MPDKIPPYYSQTGEVPLVETDEALQAMRREAAKSPDLPAMPSDSSSTGMIPRFLLSSEDHDGGAPRDADSPGGA